MTRSSWNSKTIREFVVIEAKFSFFKFYIANSIDREDEEETIDVMNNRKYLSLCVRAKVSPKQIIVTNVSLNFPLYCEFPRLSFSTYLFEFSLLSSSEGCLIKKQWRRFRYLASSNKILFITGGIDHKFCNKNFLEDLSRKFHGSFWFCQKSFNFISNFFLGLT